MYCHPDANLFLFHSLDRIVTNLGTIILHFQVELVDEILLYLLKTLGYFWFYEFFSALKAVDVI